jgi:trimethylamine--corrinoid protein Co-methyltransferase
LVTALSGGNLIHDVGYIEGGLTASYEMLVSMDEIAGLVKRFMRGVEINSETLALDVIDRVGPGGHYVAEDHTFRHFRENWVPKLLDRATRGDWETDGRLTLGDRAAARVRDILENHQPSALDQSIAAELETIIQRAENRA